ncbi:MAG: ATP-binding protein [Micropruina sp.]|uniref:ATP-binding protein n=1 Tax=Micropruina sp. TaxID=2737536 RepID=UPI0039E695BF
MTDSLGHLVGRAALVEWRVRTLIDERRAGDPNPDDAFRGLYLSDEAIDRLLDGGPDRPMPVTADQIDALDGEAGPEVRLLRLARSAGLTPLDVELLLIAAMPDLDPRFERLYGYLNDDVTRRRASVGLALQLAGAALLSAQARGRLKPSRPLVRHGLVVVEDADRPLLGRALRVPDRVIAHLLGDDTPDAALVGVLGDADAHVSPLSRQLAGALANGVALVHLRERLLGSGAATASAALLEAGRGAVVLDLTRVVAAPEPHAVARLAVREAVLRDAGLVAAPVEQLAQTHPDIVRRLSECGVPVLLAGSASWDPQWSGATPLTVDAPVLTVSDRLGLWAGQLAAAGGAADRLDPSALAGHLALGPAQVRRAIEAAGIAASLRDGVITADDLRRGVRAQNAAGLERLARRIEPEVGWDDLVVTPNVRRALADLTARARHRDTVLAEWRMRRGGGRGRGVTALFAGDSGTGKTLSAEVIAGDLGLDLYTVNLATVVDKYVGETEKNLERIFAEAGGVNAVLFFDEADAIFGKRSDVKDAHDRYANIESAYLLQRLETFDGLAVLATNLRANIDEAFTRRLDAIIDFPSPTEELRRALWEHCLAAPLPVADDLDLDFLAEAFELAGGNIRSAATTAAYLAAAEGGPVTMRLVVAAVEQEYRKLGRLVLEREFGRFYASL